MDLSALLSSFALLFLAEMGDKTQLAVMTLSHRHRAASVIGGAFAAFLVLNAAAVAVGTTLYLYVPERPMMAAAAALFLGFAWRAWRDASEEPDADAAPRAARSALLLTFTLVLVAELGDKTQLAMVALAASTGAAWSVLVGGTLALWAVSALGVVVGATLLRRVPTPWVHRGAALMFLAFGLLALVEAVRVAGPAMNATP